ncbi:MAG: hypothetical protein QOH47_827 [Sphingomonadales bacterium]|jgi:phage host-nuclease inhibitor protein Gam|nr:hypothetical protein [Sphingomonadales bacterium]
MSAPKTPRNVAEATALLEHYGELAEAAAFIETTRNAAIASANAQADAELAPLLTELAAIAARAERWWTAKGRAALAEKRKSIELGGCEIGSRASGAKLAHGFDDDDKAVEALRGTRFGNLTTKTKHSLDRAATLKLLKAGGKTGKALEALGFKIDAGADSFFLTRIEQAGTIAPH